MPENRPMPLTGDDEIPVDPLLGKSTDNYPGRRLRALGIGWGIFVPAAMVFNLAFVDYQHLTWVPPLVVITVTIMGLVTGWWVLHQWNREIILYEHGFSYREGSENVPFLFAEVVAIRLRAEQVGYFFGLFRRVIYRVTIRMRGGDRIRLDNSYRRIEQFSAELQRHVYERLRVAVHTGLEAGEKIQFADDLYITADGVYIESDSLDDLSSGQFLAWDSLQGHRVANRQLMLIRDDESVWFAIPLADVDNLVLLLELLREKKQHTQEQIL